jgi:hypothetical protein
MGVTTPHGPEHRDRLAGKPAVIEGGMRGRSIGGTTAQRQEAARGQPGTGNE